MEDATGIIGISTRASLSKLELRVAVTVQTHGKN